MLIVAKFRGGDTQSKYLLGLGFCLATWIGVLIAADAIAAPRVYTPNTPTSDPLGVYIRLDYTAMDDVEELNYDEMKTGKDWNAVLSNYYFSIHKRDREAFLELHTERDGGKLLAEKWVNTVIPDNIEITISNVQNLGMFRLGKLILPLVNSEINPPYAAPVPIIICYEDSCYKTIGQFRQDFDQFYRLVRGKYEKHLRDLSESEFDQFGALENNLQHYTLTPLNPEHQAPNKPEYNPTVFLKLENYPERQSIRLVPNKNSSDLAQLTPEVKAVLDLLTEINSLDEASLNDEVKLSEIFQRSFDDPRISDFRLPLFRLEEGGYENSAQRILNYVTTASRWDAIVPVGYLDQGQIRYVIFYPETSFFPLDKNGQGVIQVLPVVNVDGTYKLSYSGLHFTYLSTLQLPEAIELYMNYFDRNRPPQMSVESKDETPEIDLSNDEDRTSGSEGRTATYMLIVALLVILLLSAAIWLVKRTRR